MPNDSMFYNFDSDAYSQKVTALRINQEEETVFHQHQRGQLVMPLSGFVTCTIADAIWMVPANCAVWIPSQVFHSNRISSGSDVCMLFIDPDIKGIPEKSCTLSISPLLRESIIALSSVDQHYEAEGRTARLVEVLIDELTAMPAEHFDFPIPSEPRLHKIAKEMYGDPSNRLTVGEWAKRFAMSERTLSRLVKQELGMTFGHWRSQLHIVLALQKLSSGDAVHRIAEDLGYESVSAFISFFKKTLGRSPKQYMKIK